MLFDAWRLAVGTLTAVPVRPPKTVDRRRAGLAMLLAPLAVLPLSLALALMVALGHWLTLSYAITALLAIAVTVVGNRGFHLDGLSDVADGLAASFDRDRSLQVMKSGTSGPAGVVATVLVIGLQVSGLAALLGSVEWWRAAVVAGLALCLSRVALVISCTRGIPAARQDGLGETYTQSITRSGAVALVALAAALLSFAGCWAGLEWWRGALAMAIATVVCLIMVLHAVRRFGGVTGDVFGAAVEIALAAIFVVLS